MLARVQAFGFSSSTLIGVALLSGYYLWNPRSLKVLLFLLGLSIALTLVVSNIPQVRSVLDRARNPNQAEAPKPTVPPSQRAWSVLQIIAFPAIVLAVVLATSWGDRIFLAAAAFAVAKYLIFRSIGDLLLHVSALMVAWTWLHYGYEGEFRSLPLILGLSLIMGDIAYLKTPAAATE